MRPAALPTRPMVSAAGRRYRLEITTDAPKPNPVLLGSWANCGKTMNDAYRPAPSRNAARFVVHTPRRRIIVMSTSGSRLRTSTMTQATQNTAPTANSASVRVPPQPQTPVWAMPMRIAQMPTVMRAAASQLTRPGVRTGDSGMNFQVANAPASVITSGIQNSQCQPRCSSISAPTTSPAPAPTPRIEDMSPMLPGTFSRGNSSRTIAKASGKMPPATPWMTRATMSMPSDCETAASSVPKLSTSSVHSSSRSLPYMSPRRPMIAVPTEAESRKPVSSQVTPVSLACRSCWNDGRAGITAELSTA